MRPLARLRYTLPALVEPVVIIVVTLGPLVASTTALWIFQDWLQSDWADHWRDAVRFWFLGVWTPVTVAPGQEVTGFVLSLAPLGLTAFVLWRSIAGGRRFAADDLLWPSWLAFAAMSVGVVALLAWSASDEAAWIDAPLGTALGAGLMTVGFVAGSVTGQGGDGSADAGSEAPERRWLRARAAALREVLPESARADAAAVGRSLGMTLLLLLAGSAAALTAAFLVSWMGMVAVYENLNTDVLGVLLLTGLQLLYLPTLVIWSCGWLLGAGVTLGTGSLVSPFGSAVGALPTIPVFAALPPGGSAWWIVAVAVPTAAVVGGVWYGFGRQPGAHPWPGLGWLLLWAVVIAAALSAVVWLAALLASGSIGPGRLGGVGVPLDRALLFPLWVAVPAFIVLLVLRSRGDMRGLGCATVAAERSIDSDAAA